MSGIRLIPTDPDDIPTPPAGAQTQFLNSLTGLWSVMDHDRVVTSLQGANGADGALSYENHGNTGSTETVDASTNVHRLVLNAATVTLTLTGAPASGTPGIVQLYLVGDGATTVTLVWPGSVDFGDAGEPDLLVTGTILVNLETVDGGSTWVGTQEGRPGTAGADGADGTAGGAISIPYTFSTTTTDSDPGSGVLRLSNATQTSATVIRADLLSSDGTDWSAVLATLADSTNTVKGHIRLFKTDDPTKWLLFTVSALASPSGYKNITVANVGGSTSSPFSNSDAITLTFTRAGDVGGSGGGATATMNQLGADVTMTNANQFYDGPALTLAVGTYVLFASLCVEGIGGTIAQATAKLWDGTTVVASAELMTYGGGAWDNNQVSLVGLVVIASGTPTWKVSVAGLAAGGGKIKAAASDNGVGNNASTLVAIKIA